MKIWRFQARFGSEYADAFVPGRFLPSMDSAETLTIEWEAGSDRIGDFSLGLAQELIVTKQVGDALCDRFRGVVQRPITMVQDKKLRRPKRVTSRTKPRVWLPYEGPPLVNLRITDTIDADSERWPIVPGRFGEPFRIEGVAGFGESYLQELLGAWRVTGRHTAERVKRNPNKGFFIAQSAIGDLDFFRIWDQGIRLPDGTFDRSRLADRPVADLGWNFCTDRVRQFIADRGYSNVELLEFGDTYEA